MASNFPPFEFNVPLLHSGPDIACAWVPAPGFDVPIWLQLSRITLADQRVCNLYAWAAGQQDDVAELIQRLPGKTGHCGRALARYMDQRQFMDAIVRALMEKLRA